MHTSGGKSRQRMTEKKPYDLFFISVFCYCQLVAREPFHYLKFFFVIAGVVVIAFFLFYHIQTVYIWFS